MGYDRGDSFPFDFDPNGNPFGSKSKRNLSPQSYPIQCERKWNTSFLSVQTSPAYCEYSREKPKNPIKNPTAGKVRPAVK